MTFDQANGHYHELDSQRWERPEDGAMFRGTNFADKLQHLNVYPDAKPALLASKVGDCITTGVSAYVRVK